MQLRGVSPNTKPAMKNLIDNGHRVDAPGKRSPDVELQEYA